MNRRDLFRGAGALALSAAMPVQPAWDETPVTAESLADFMAEKLKEQPWFIAYSRAFEEGMMHGFPDSEPRQFEGLKPRLNVVDEATSFGDNTSIWLVSYGPESVAYSPNIYEEGPTIVWSRP